MSGREVVGRHALQLAPDLPAELVAGATKVEMLLLQARPIGEPVAQQGPFVMNSGPEIQQAYADYRRTGFGGAIKSSWPRVRESMVRDATASLKASASRNA